METDTGWSRAAGESSGRWRTILDRAAGRARVPGGDEGPDAQAPVQAAPSPPPGTGAVPQYPGVSQAYPTATAQPAAPGYPPASAAYPGPPYPAAVPPGTGAPGGYGTPPSYVPAPAPAYGPPGPAAPARDYPAAVPSYGPPTQPAPPYGAPTQPAPSYGPPAQPGPPPLPPPPVAPLGIRPAPGSAAERAVSILRRNLGVPRVIAFANPKGGVHKTTATVLAAAAIGGARARGVIAWDDNELRGTLGLRAGSARHAKTIRHLVSELAEVELNTGPALMARIDDFLRHASDGTYDVLAGEEDPRFAWRLDPPTVRRVLDLLTRTHEVICVDTGNNVESGNWRTIMEAADQLVITTVPREDSAFSADWMMDVLVEAGREELVANAVTLISMTTPRPGPMQDDLIRHFRQRNRAVCVVPYDPALEQGGWIDHTVLQPATREAWLEAAAVIMEPLGS